MIGKILLFIFGAIIGIVFLFCLMILAHLLWVHYKIIAQRIDDYYQDRENQREAEEIYKFKKKL